MSWVGRDEAARRRLRRKASPAYRAAIERSRRMMFKQTHEEGRPRPVLEATIEEGEALDVLVDTGLGPGRRLRVELAPEGELRVHMDPGQISFTGACEAVLEAVRDGEVEGSPRDG